MTDETNTGTTGESETSGDPVDAALREFDAASTTKPEQTTKPQDTDISEEVRWLKAERERTERERAETSLRETAKAIKGEAGVSDKAVMGWLNELARDDPALNKAYVNRESNPKAWGKVLEGLGTKMREDFGIKEPEPDNREAVEAAVRSASTKTQEDAPLTREQWRKMSPEDQRKAQLQAGVTPV